MKDKIVLICDSDENTLQELKEGLANSDFPVHTLTDAAAVVSKASAQPCILIINPDMKGFNEYDVCKKLKQDKGIPVIFLLDQHSTTRAHFGECEADDVVTRPVEMDNLKNLLAKHYTVTSNTK